MSKKRVSYKWPCEICGHKVNHFESDSGRTWTSRCNYCGWKREASPVLGPGGKPMVGANGRWLFNVSYTKPAQADLHNSPLPGEKACEVYLHNLSGDNGDSPAGENNNEQAAPAWAGWLKELGKLWTITKR